MPEMLVDTLKRIVISKIFFHEGAWALSVRSDFLDGLEQQPTDSDKTAYCRMWVGFYVRGVHMVRSVN